MAIHTRLSPGTEIHDIDKSRYNATRRNVTTDTVTLICGYADKGEDIAVKQIDSKQQLIDSYGYPKTEFERYFYNGAMEILNKGGQLLMSKMPYQNEATDKFAYCEYKIDRFSNVGDFQISDDIQAFDPTLVNFISLSSVEYSYSPSCLISNSELEQLLASKKKVNLNTIKIVDITRQQYDAATVYVKQNSMLSIVEKECECLGIMPVIVSPINALYFQDKIAQHDDLLSCFEPISNFRRTFDKKSITESLSMSKESMKINLYESFSGNSMNDSTVSRTVSKLFPNILMTGNNSVSRENMKKIAVVVMKAYKDSSNSNTIRFAPLEVHVGSLFKNSTDSSGKSDYIDSVVNSNSELIRMFTNIKTESLDSENSKLIDSIYIKDQIGTVLGFSKQQTLKDITYQSIFESINKIFSFCKSKNSVMLDTIADAGLTTIAQCAHYAQNAKSSTEKEQMILNDEWFEGWTLTAQNQMEIHYSLASAFDNFCKNTRQDCMFILDGPRNFSIEGSKKIVDRSNLSATIENTIVPKLSFLKNLNSSYSAGYLDWFYCLDESTQQYFWCPPSIKVAGIITYVDSYYHKWDAPAGINRARVDNCIDVSFNPSDDEAGKMYERNWNYAVSYPVYGITVEGQKTFQTQNSAFDRINVRRLMNYLERSVENSSRYFIYESNTEFQRQKFVNSIVPIFENAVNGYGIKEYAIKCDSENNTSEIIDRHEMACTIALKPVKTTEWIVLKFACTNQSMTVSEEVY